MSGVIDLVIDIDGVPYQLTGTVVPADKPDTIHFKPLTSTEGLSDLLEPPNQPLEATTSDSTAIQAMILDHEMQLYRDVYVNCGITGTKEADRAVDAFRQYFKLNQEAD